MNRTLLRENIVSCFKAGVNAVLPSACFARNREQILKLAAGLPESLVVAGAGKAGRSMAVAAESLFGSRIRSGFVVVPANVLGSEGSPDPDGKTCFLRGGHPYPDSWSVDSTRQLLVALAETPQSTGVLGLLSGGGSALLEYPAAGLVLQDLVLTSRILMESGADIRSLNCVRKHLSAIKGGQLALKLGGRKALILCISDVPDDDLSVLASGPFSPDPTTFETAYRLIVDQPVADLVPPRVKRHLRLGMEGKIGETPTVENPVFENISSLVVGSLSDALEGVRREAKLLGWDAKVVSEKLGQNVKEAREIGGILAAEILTCPENKRTCLIWGGEPTVSVTGTGVGGRNQELALTVGDILHKAKSDAMFLSAGTDGIDGPTPAAGAWTDSLQIDRMWLKGAIPGHFLNENASFDYFSACDGLVVTGPTSTNVSDIQIALIP